GDARSLSLTTKNFCTIADAPRLIAEAVTPGFAGRVRLSLTRHGLSKVLPNVHIKIEQSPEGQLSLVRTTNFFSQMDTSTEAAKERLHAALFGSESHIMRRIAQVPLRKEVETFLNSLPQPVAIGGPVTTLKTSLIVEGTSTRCDFTAWPGIGYIGFV